MKNATGVTDGPRSRRHDGPMNTTHGQRSMHDRRATNEEQIAFYLRQARLAEQGHTTRQTKEYFLRQVEYFRMEIELSK